MKMFSSFQGSKKGEAYVFSSVLVFVAYALAVVYNDTSNFSHFAIYMTVAAPSYIITQGQIDNTKAKRMSPEDFPK